MLKVKGKLIRMSFEVEQKTNSLVFLYNKRYQHAINNRRNKSHPKAKRHQTLNHIIADTFILYEVKNGSIKKSTPDKAHHFVGDVCKCLFNDP